MYTFCILTVVRVHVLYCECYVCIFCIVTVLRLHFLYFDSFTCIRFYCYSVTCICFVL